LCPQAQEEWPWFYIDRTPASTARVHSRVSFRSHIPEDEVPSAYTAKGGEYISMVGLTGHYERREPSWRGGRLDSVRQLSKGEGLTD